MLLDMRQSFLESWNINCFEAIPISYAIFDRDVCVVLVEVILVENEDIWEDVSKQTG